jgi:hypothetical protein
MTAVHKRGTIGFLRIAARFGRKPGAPGAIERVSTAQPVPLKPMADSRFAGSFSGSPKTLSPANVASGGQKAAARGDVLTLPSRKAGEFTAKERATPPHSRSGMGENVFVSKTGNI